MSTSAQLMNEINMLRHHAESSLARSQGAPYPNFERAKKIQALQEEARSIVEGAAAEIAQLEAPVRVAHEALTSTIGEKTAELREIQRQSQQAQDIYQAKNQEHRARIKEAAVKGQGQS